MCTDGPHSLTSARREQFAARILDWSARHGRTDLPWQHDPTPYRVWVSEIMLQQTRVSVVIPYFDRFMQRFPDLQRLAEADQDAVLHLWSGLGYYARARNLQRAARIVVSDHGGRFPEQLETVRTLPGIGRSTAGAILSLACGQRQTILDGNVRRALSRCFAVDGWPGHRAVLEQLWALAEGLTPHTRVAAYNQAMMDLGATLCTRSRPACERCPVAGQCVALARGQPCAYPAPKPRREVPARAARLLLVHRPDGHVLLQQRPPNGIWGGLWVLPELPPGQDPAAWCRQHLGVDLAWLEKLPPRRHTFSHFHLDIQPMAAMLRHEPAAVADDTSRWTNPASPGALGVPSPVQRLLRESAALPRIQSGEDE